MTVRPSADPGRGAGDDHDAARRVPDRLLDLGVLPDPMASPMEGHRTMARRRWPRGSRRATNAGPPAELCPGRQPLSVDRSGVDQDLGSSTGALRDVRIIVHGGCDQRSLGQQHQLECHLAGAPEPCAACGLL